MTEADRNGSIFLPGMKLANAKVVRANYSGWSCHMFTRLLLAASLYVMVLAAGYDGEEMQAHFEAGVTHEANQTDAWAFDQASL